MAALDVAKAISMGTTLSPVIASNHIVINAENCPNSKLVGVLVEEHHYYGSTDCNRKKEQPGKINHPNRIAVAKWIAKYKAEEGWMYPLPWEQSLKLEPEEFYVELTLDVYSKNGLYSKGVKANVEEVFDPLLPGGLPVQRVLIQGNAGYGKSSLCQKAVYDWAHGVTTFRALPWECSLPVLIKLRFLDQASKLEDLILDSIASYYTPQDRNHDVKYFITSLGRNLVLILDGYDELDQASQCNVISVLESWKLWNKDSPLCCASLLVTTRPTSDEKFLLLFEKHFFITSISDDNVEILVKKFNAYTCSLVDECVSQIDKLFSKFFRHPKTRLLEKCLNSRIKKKVYLREMPPLIIAVICWVMKQSRVDFRSKDIIYNCLELLSKRCNQREQFGYTDDHVADVLLRFGLLCFKIEKTVIEEICLRGELKFDFSFLVLTGILKCSGDHDGLTLWEPVHKSFLDALVYAALACDEVETLSRSEIKEFLNSDITTSCGLITMYVSIAANNTFFGCTEISYCSREKKAFLKWNEKYKNVSYLQKFETSEDLFFCLNIKQFDRETLEAFIRDFPKFRPLVKESNDLQRFLNVQGVEKYAMTLGLRSPVKESFNLFFPGTKNVFKMLLTYRVRFLSIIRQRDVSSLEEFLHQFLELPRRNRWSPDMFFSDAISHFEETGLKDWEITAHLSVSNEVKQYSDTLRFNSEKCSRSSCSWEQIKEVSVSYVGPRLPQEFRFDKYLRDRDRPRVPAMILWKSPSDLSDSSCESEEILKESSLNCLSRRTNRKQASTHKLKSLSFLDEKMFGNKD